MKVSIKRKNNGDLPSSSTCSLNCIEEKFDILVNLKTFIKNYPVKLEIKGLTERKNQ